MRCHNGSDEQIFGANEQVSAGLVQKMHSVSEALVITTIASSVS